MKTALAAVARVAFLTSEVVVDVTPSSEISRSRFANVYDSLVTPSTHTPRLIISPHGADAGAKLMQETSKSNLTSLTLLSHPEIILRLLPYLPSLSASPLVLHIGVKGDLSDVLTLRTAIPFLIHSDTSQQAHDHALLASRLARTEKKAVLHVFHADIEPQNVVEVEADSVLPFLVAEKRTTRPRSGSSASFMSHPNNSGISVRHANVDSRPTSPAPGSPASISSPYSLEEGYESDLFGEYNSASLSTLALVRRPLRPLSYFGHRSPHTLLITFGYARLARPPESVALLDVALLHPLPPARLLAAIPKSVKRIIVLEQVHKWHVKWTPLFLDVVGALQSWDEDRRPQVLSGVLGDVTGKGTEASLEHLLKNTYTNVPRDQLVLGALPPKTNGSLPQVPHVPTHEASYTKILLHLFSDRLEISNDPELVPVYGDVATRPEFALGRVQGQIEARDELIRTIHELVEAESTLVPPELHSLLSKWLLAKNDGIKSGTLGDEIISFLENTPVNHPAASKALSLQDHLPFLSRWIIGSDAWSYDLGSSGIHHAISSGANINLLLLDTLPYTTRNAADPNKRKKDVGLYAMNHGNVYVASVAVYSSYSQVLQAFIEADEFNGPSIVLAYLPYESESVPALTVLKETKLAVDSGYWPLYRWNPDKEKLGQEPFELDSDTIKADLREFLERQNHLSQLERTTPQLASELVSSLGQSLIEARKHRAKAAYESLLSAMDGPPLLVLYASDGGAAEKIAKRLALRAKARGLVTRCATMDSVPLEELQHEGYVAFITSTAGQGEPPQNGRNTFKALNTAAARGDAIFYELKFSVFGMGDSHYWPRPEDAQYYNKPGKDLDKRLEQLGAERITQLGLGDDQDADGPQTGYKLWEPLLWKALGVDSVEITEAEPEPITNENIKIASNFLRGTIAEGLRDTTTGALAPSDGQLTKFHGIYEQDDRDIRDERTDAGLEPAYAFMIRVRMPGGVCQPYQWLAMDQIADERGNGTFKLTTRQTFQFHGVIKKHLKPSIQAINKALLDTIAACGDVNRNVLCTSLPSLSHLHEQAYEFAKTLSERLLPKTTAYHEIWMDKKMVAGDAIKDFEPMYGPYYLPRKFKVAVAIPPNNDVDVYANDVGLIAIPDQKGGLAGFNITAGGGMGVTHANKKTYPRLGSLLGFCTVEQAYAVAEHILLVQRDHGNRKDRKNARLKYTIDRMGLDVFKAEVEKGLGWKLEPVRAFSFTSNVDEFGWVQDKLGKHHFTTFIENGRVQDEPGRDFKTGLREIARIHKGTFRLTANQHLIISDVADAELPRIKSMLAKYKLDNLSHTGLRLSSSACVAFPTCGLAMAESERYLPVLIDKVEKICEENGLRNDSIVMRMTGCPNGCARPYVAEVAFVGKAPGSYLMLLGGGYYGQRLNKIYRENVTEPDILAILRPMIKHYALERQEGERFGDFVIRAGYISATTEGREWYEGMGGQGQYQE